MSDRLPWHGYQSLGQFVITNALLIPILSIAGWVALAMADDRYVQSPELSSAVAQIQLGQTEDRIAVLDTQIQIAHRRLSNSVVGSPDYNEIADEIRVLEDAKAQSERQRQKLMM